MLWHVVWSFIKYASLNQYIALPSPYLQNVRCCIWAFPLVIHIKLAWKKNAVDSDTSCLGNSHITMTHYLSDNTPIHLLSITLIYCNPVWQNKTDQLCFKLQARNRATTCPFVIRCLAGILVLLPSSCHMSNQNTVQWCISVYTVFSCLLVCFHYFCYLLSYHFQVCANFTTKSIITTKLWT